MPDIVVQVQKRMLVSLAQIAKKVGLKEGDHILLEERDGGIFLRPVGWHDKSQEYFWTKEWQEDMKRSVEDLEQGRYKTFKSADELIKELGGDADEDADSNPN
jgi:bifunctional DNA-binding transcriptional regulator/antitoxin component of YhaV-PrlF toxin-antitoxin module